MPKNPLVSIIMPVYNAGPHLTEALITHLNQTYRNIELIAINDGSTDGSRETLERFAQFDNRLRIINKENGGIVSAMNLGIEESRGEYLARADADDASFLTRIEKQVAAIEANPRAVLVATGFEVMDENSEFMYREIIPTRDVDIKRAMFLYNPIAHGSVLLRKETVVALGGYSSNCGPTEDYELWMRMAKEGDFIGIEDLLYKWRQNRKGITFTNNPAMQKHTLLNLEKYWNDNTVSTLTRKEIIATGDFYIKNNRRYGVDTKNIVFSNIGQVAAKLIKSKHYKEGVMQLVSLASTGRTGLKFTTQRITTIIRARFINRR